MMRWLSFDVTPEGGGGALPRPIVSNDVSELRRYLSWLALVILLGLCTMFGVVALAWWRYG